MTTQELITELLEHDRNARVLIDTTKVIKESVDQELNAVELGETTGTIILTAI